MHFLKLCFVLMVFGISAKAQEKDSCSIIFHFISGNGIVVMDWIPFPLMICRQKRSRITSRWTPSIVRASFLSNMPRGTTFNHNHLQVTSLDGKINYQIKSFDFTTNAVDPFGGTQYCPGDSLTQKH